MTRAALAAIALAACTDPADPCADIAGPCATVRVESDVVDRIDQLELNLTYGDVRATITTAAPNGALTELPLAVAIELADPPPQALGVVAAGKSSGHVLGTGAASTTLDGDARPTLVLHLAAPETCTAGTLYCGGDKLAGDPRTLYECNAGGVPLSRGVCPGACTVAPGKPDACAAVGGACQDGGRYCGGDKLAGDPQTLYTCSAGAGTNAMRCANGCAVRPRTDDACK